MRADLVACRLQVQTDCRGSHLQSTYLLVLDVHISVRLERRMEDEAGKGNQNQDAESQPNALGGRSLGDSDDGDVLLLHRTPLSSSLIPQGAEGGDPGSLPFPPP